MERINATTTIPERKSRLKVCGRCLFWPCRCNEITGDTMSPEESEIVKRAKIVLYARMVRNEAQFKRILLDASVDKRKGVYNMIAPHLRFKVKPYFLLMGRE